MTIINAQLNFALLYELNGTVGSAFAQEERAVTLVNFLDPSSLNGLVDLVMIPYEGIRKDG